MPKKKAKIKRNIRLSTRLHRIASFTSKSLNKAYIDYKQSKKIQEKKELKLKELQINKDYEKIKEKEKEQRLKDNDQIRKEDELKLKFEEQKLKQEQQERKQEEQRIKDKEQKLKDEARALKALQGLMDLSFQTLLCADGFQLLSGGKEALTLFLARNQS